MPSSGHLSTAPNSGFRTHEFEVPRSTLRLAGFHWNFEWMNKNLVPTNVGRISQNYRWALELQIKTSNRGPENGQSLYSGCRNSFRLILCACCSQRLLFSSTSHFPFKCLWNMIYFLIFAQHAKNCFKMLPELRPPGRLKKGSLDHQEARHFLPVSGNVSMSREIYCYDYIGNRNPRIVSLHYVPLCN